MFSAVFLGVVSWKLPLTSAGSLMQSSDSHLNSASFDPPWTHGESSPVGDTACFPPCVCFPTGFPTRKQQDCRDSRDSLDTVLSETVMTVSLSASATIVCTVQWTFSAFQDSRNYLVSKPKFRLTTIALTPTDIHHRHSGGMSTLKKHRHLPSCHHNNTTLTHAYSPFPIFDENPSTMFWITEWQLQWFYDIPPWR